MKVRLFHLSLLAVAICLTASCSGKSKESDDLTVDNSPLTWSEASALNAEAVVLMDQAEVGKAIKVFEELSRRTEGLFVPRFNLAIGLLNAQNVDRAAREAEMVRSEELLREVMKEFPDRVHAPYSLAVLLEHLGRDQDEIETLFARALALAPSHPECLYRMGKFYFQKRPPELEKAEALLRRALELEGHFASAWNTLFGTYHRLKKPELAKAAMATFSSYSDSLPEQGKKLSLVYNFMGEYGSCIRAIDMSAPVDQGPTPQLAFALSKSPTALDSSVSQTDPQSPAANDLDADGNLEIFYGGRLLTWNGTTFVDVTARWGLPPMSGCRGGVFADLDHDHDLDLLCFGSFGIRTFLSDGKRLSAVNFLPKSDDEVHSLSVADVDHDGDLDIIASNAIYSNLRPTIYESDDLERKAFKRIEWEQVDPKSKNFEFVLLCDIDRDGDLDMIRSSNKEGAVLLANDRLWRFHRVKELPLTGIGGPLFASDLDQDGRPDIVGSRPGAWQAKSSSLLNRFPAQFVAGTELRSNPEATHLVTADIDNDGRPDALSIDKNGVLSIAQNRQDKPSIMKVEGTWSSLLVRDLDQDGRLDLILFDHKKNAASWALNTTKDAGNFLRIQLKGKRSNGNASSWSNHFGVGAFIEVTAGPNRIFLDYMAKNGLNDSSGAKVHVGIGRAKQVDSIRLIWPDFVLQNETGGKANQDVVYEEVNRKASSCPVLFKYSGVGDEFEFVTDFLGVGGLGFFLEPGHYAPADNTETVRIGDLPAKDGRLELRITEPMEEISYFDQLRLIAVDHLVEDELQADERLSTNESMPTGAPLLFKKSFRPTAARTKSGLDCLKEVLVKDRKYQGDLDLDPRFIGYLENEQHLKLKFPIAAILKEKPHPQATLQLFLDGWVEYPYSHVNYAAWESGVRGESFSLDVSSDGKNWKPSMKEVGYPGGMTRCMSMEITSSMNASINWIRLRTNLEVHVDRARIAWVTKPQAERVKVLEFDQAELRFLGYPREVSPDGQMPKLYDYQNLDRTFDWKRMAGRFTTYGDVADLIASSDQRLVVMNHGEEIALSVAEDKLPSLAPGWKRTFFLQAVGWCKDMDPYTAFPDTVAPMPDVKESYFPGRMKKVHTDIGQERRLSGTFR